MIFMLVYFITLIFTSALYAEKILQDEIIVMIYSPQRQVAITRSDIRPALDGAPRTLREIVLEHLMFLDKISMNGEDDTDVERFLAQIQKQNGLSRTALEELFKQMGYSYEEGREQLKIKQTVDSVIDFRVRQDKRMLITSEDVRAYYDTHPLYTPTLVTLQQAYLPYEEFTTEAIEKMASDRIFPETIAWEEPFELQDTDLAEDKQFVKTAPLKSIVEQEKDDEGVLVTRLVARVEPVLVPFETRKQDIETELRKERYYLVLHEYQDKLLRDANIYFAHEKDRKAVVGI